MYVNFKFYVIGLFNYIVLFILFFCLGVLYVLRIIYYKEGVLGYYKGMNIKNCFF